MIENLDLHSMCFLCKRTSDVTEEHVFPQWLQRDYNLINQFIVLKNGTKFKYGNLTVPCCSECNNKYLSIIENKISRAIRNGDVDYLKSNHHDTFIWLYKLMYGLHYKEMFLKENIRDPLSLSIVSKKDFFENHSYNLFPLYARGAIVFEDFSPYSLFVFKLSDQIKGGYFYADEPYKLFSSIVLGKVGIVCSFQCDGYIEADIKKHLKIDQYGSLSLAQFGDFSAFVLHLKSRMKMLPNYICHSESGRFVFKMQQPKDIERYSNFDLNRQIEFTTKIFSALFQNEIDTDANGDKIMKYKSPYMYF